jgi:hypothetical protein
LTPVKAGEKGRHEACAVAPRIAQYAVQSSMEGLFGTTEGYKKMKKNGVIVASALAAMFAFTANAQDKAAAKEKAADGVMCTGVNECKGKGACGGAGMANECKGKNACKGKGVTAMKTDKECTDKKGTVAKKP